MRTDSEIRTELKAAGADAVMFRDEYDIRCAIAVTKGEERKAYAWRVDRQDSTDAAVTKLKEWLDARAR
jgi:hypothetical protein